MKAGTIYCPPEDGKHVMKPLFQRMEVGLGSGRSLRKVPGPERASKARCLGVISDGDPGPMVGQKMSGTVDQGLVDQE